MRKLDPLNLDLIFATDADVRYLRPTTVTDIYDGVSSNFNEDGLFSTTTFGRVGSPERDERFSYIRLNASIIHPLIFNTLKRLKRLYHDIMLGKQYAVFNPETKDFEVSDMFTGDTGMAFFIKHIKELEPDKRRSKRRNFYIDVFDKYKDRVLMHNCLVIPAGLRDLQVDPDGKETQDEINEMYRRLISIAANINLVGAKSNDPIIDNQRRNLQLTIVEIYDYIENMLEGKKGLIQAKWGGRRIVNGTRNVISSIDTTAEVLGDLRAPHVDQIQVGLLQTLVGALPVAINRLKEKFLNDVFINQNHLTTLIHPKTWKPVDVELDPYVWDKWGTIEGLEKLIEGFRDDRVRHKPVIIQGHYLYLVYRKGNVFKCFRNIDELPSQLSKEDVHPITYVELFYLAGYEKWYTLPAMYVRYPITSVQSAVIAKLYTKTTSVSYGVYELGEDWQTKIGYAREYPDISPTMDYVNTAIPPFTSLDGLGGDYDGDTISVNILYTKEAIEEVDTYLNSRRSILDPKGQFKFSADTAIPKRVCLAFTGQPIAREKLIRKEG